VAGEKNELTEEAQRIITTIKQMEASLDDNKSRQEYQPEDEALKITYPLLRCLQALKEKLAQISKLHRERFEQVKSKQ
jgi:protein regulator of cytokinesis 1